MPEIRRHPEPSLDDIHLSDSFIEALAAGLPAASRDHSDAELAALLGGWRDENRWPPDTGLISEAQAVAALNAGLAEKPVRRGLRERRDNPSPARHRRGLSVVGAAAAAALCLGGFGAMVNGSQPGDSLYGLRTMMFGTPKQVRDEQVTLAARSELLKVQELISQGDWQQAQEKLVAVSTQVAAVGDEVQKQELLNQFNDLSAKVVERDPEATAPPGIVYTVPPSADELVPVVAPTSETTTTEPPTSGAATSSGESTTTEPSTSGAATSSAEATTSTSGVTSTSGATSSAGATTSAASSSVSTSSSAASSSSTASSSTASSSTVASTSSAATSTPASASAPASTSAAQASTSAPAQTSSPAPAAATSSTPTTTAAPTSSAASSSTAASSSSAAATSSALSSAAPKSTTTAAATTTAQATMAQTTTGQPVTTTVVPVPAG